MRAPSAGVPLPGGRPVPSGRTLMSQAAISAGVSGFPRLGACATAVLEPRTSVSKTAYLRSLRVYMLHLPRALDGPSCDRVVVLAREAGHRRCSCGLAAYRHKFGARGLYIARLVPCAALQYGRAAVPPPRQAESRESLAQDRFLQRRL